MTVIPKEAVGWVGTNSRDGGGSWLDLIAWMKVETRGKKWNPGGLGRCQVMR